MRYWELQRDPREDERELAKKVRPATNVGEWPGPGLRTSV